MKWFIIGVDVGGTNTDVVCLHGNEVIAFDKVPTTEDVTSGLREAIDNVLQKLPNEKWTIGRINIGTTHFVNALVQRRDLVPVSVVRLCGPASRALAPFDAFPAALQALIRAKCFFINGGYQVDGSPITEVDEEEVIRVIGEIKESEVQNIVISGIFAPLNDHQEKQVQELFRVHFPEASVTLSSGIGSIGLLERENAAILNESLKPLCHRTIHALAQALQELNLNCPFFLTQNDGTIISSSEALNFPVKTFSSGPTNSMRGASHLSGIKDAIVVDIGGTTTDVGSLKGGFPRQSSSCVEVGGVSTNFRMPDVLSIGLGGGSIVKHRTEVDQVKVKVGPTSVGYRLTAEAMAFGGSTLTATDIAVAFLKADVGRRNKIQTSPAVLEEANEEIQWMLEEAIDRMKVSSEPVPVILVGAGSILKDTKRPMIGVKEFILPPHYQVANAVGAALGQVSGYEDRTINLSGLTREEAIAAAEKQAFERCMKNGAKKDSIQIIEREEIGLSYLPGIFTWIKVKAIGDLSDEALTKARQFVSSTVEPPSLQGARPRDIEAASHDVIEEPKDPYIDKKTGEWILSHYDIHCISIGAGILGCGGGGNPRIGRLRAESALKKGKRIAVIHPDRLNEAPYKGGKTGVAAFMGAPGVTVEKLSNGIDMITVLEYLDRVIRSDLLDPSSEQRKKLNIQTNEEETEHVSDIDPNLIEPRETETSRVVALMSAEIGGLNAMEPLCVGADMGLPILDCDGMGRAFPELQMFAPAIYGCPLHPAAIVDDKAQNELILTAKGPKAVENHFRTTIGRMGCSAAVTFCPLTADKVLETCIMFSLSRSFRLGDAVLRARSEQKDPIKTICQRENGVLLVTGKIVDVCRENTGGFDRGFVQVDGTGNDEGRQVTVEFQNENLIAKSREKNKGADAKEEILATTPDLIVIVDADTGIPFATDEVRYGLRVAVIALASPPQMRTDTALKVVGPRAFNYDVDFVPIGEYQQCEPIPPPPK